MREWDSNPRRTAYETELEPLQSIPQKSTPGRTRTCDRLRVKEPPLPLGHGGSKSGRQESNLPCTAYQTVASPPGFGPSVRRVSGGSRTRLSDAAGRCLGCSATDTRSKGGRSRTLGACFGDRLLTQEHALVERGRGGTRTRKGLRLVRLPTGCHQPVGSPFPGRLSAAPAGLEPATVPLTAGRSTV